MPSPHEHIGRHQIRVRYCETDRMGVAHHGAYIDWFEEARTEWMRELGQTYRSLEDAGTLLQVVATDLRYRSSVTYDDPVVIETRMRECKRASVTMEYELRRPDGSLVATGSTTLACVDRGGKLRRLPEVFGG